MAVYGGGRALREDVVCAPNNDYGRAKLAMEEGIRKCCAAAPDGPRACALRLANVVGADSLFGALAQGTPMVIDQFADGQGPQRSYAPAQTILQAVGALLAAQTLPGVINVAAPGIVDMAHLTTAAGRSFAWRPAPKDALAELAVDTTRLQALTGQHTEVTAEGLIAQWHALKEVDI